MSAKLIEAVRTPRGEGLSPARKGLRERLLDEVSRAAITEYIRTSPEPEQTKLLAEARKRR